MISDKPFNKVHDFCEYMESFIQNINSDIKYLNTGNVAHNKASMRFKIEYLKKIYDIVKPLFKEYELELVDKEKNLLDE